MPHTLQGQSLAASPSIYKYCLVHPRGAEGRSSFPIQPSGCSAGTVWQKSPDYVGRKMRDICESAHKLNRWPRAGAGHASVGHAKPCRARSKEKSTVVRPGIALSRSKQLGTSKFSHFIPTSQLLPASAFADVICKHKIICFGCS